MFFKHGFAACARLARRMEGDFIKAGLRIDVPKCRTVPSQQRRKLGFDVDFAKGEFRVREDRWDSLMASVVRILDGSNKRMLLRTLASITGTVMSMRLSWGPLTQLFTRHLYALINSYWSLNYWADLTDGAINELLFRQGLPRARFAGPIWSPT